MKRNKFESIDWINGAVTTFLSVSGVVLLNTLLDIRPTVDVALRLAEERSAVRKMLSEQKVNIEGTFEAFTGTPSSIEGGWANFRGAAHDNVSRERIELIDTFPEAGPPVAWSVELGEGYAGAAVAKGRVYVLDYDKEKQGDALRCFSLADGEEVWRRFYRVRVKRNHGMSRTVPAVSGRFVVTLGPKGHVLCADAVSGEFLWGIDLAQRYGTRIPLWYAGQCPLIDGDTAVIAPAGRALMIGVALESGEVLWETPNPGNWEMSHSSVMPMTFHGQRMYVYSAVGGTAGIAADGDTRGDILWKTDQWNHSVISPSPVRLGGEKFLVTAGYGAGSKIFEVVRTQSGFDVEERMQLDKSRFACEQHTPIYYNGLLYSVLPSDGGALNRRLVCMTPGGETVWTSDREPRFGLGPFIIADGKIFVLDDDGMMSIVEASRERFVPLDRARVLGGRESWAPIAVAGGRMLVRDFETMVCLDMRKDRDA